MSRTDGEGDERLTRLLRAARAESDPYLWTRVRARLEAQPAAPRLVSWLERPRALAVSLALFAMAVVTSVGLLHQLPWQQPYEMVTLTDQLITGGASGAGEKPAAPATPAPGAASDTGGAS